MNSTLLDILKDFQLTASLNEDTRIYHDLNIYGDDAAEFLEKYSKTFNVNLNKFAFGDYFPSEGDKVLPVLFRLLIFKRPYKEYKELTVQDLEEGISKGYLT